MAQIILGTNETFTVGANSTATVVGGSGTEKVIVAAGSVVTADQSVERTELSGKSSDYTYSISGNVITVKSGTTTVATLTGGNGDKTIAFADGSATLALTGLNAATLGNQAISTTGSTLTPALNTADKSTAVTSGTTNGGSTTTTGSTFALTAGVDSGSSFVGTSGDDSFVADTATKLGAFDVLDGGLGTDSLIVSDATNTAYAFPTSASITGIEAFVLTHTADAAGATDAVTVDASYITNLQTIQISNGGSASDVSVTTKSNVTAVTIIGGASTSAVGTVTISDSGAASSATVAVTDKLATATLVGTGSVGISSDALTSLTLQNTGAVTVTDAYTSDARALTVNIAESSVTGGLTDAGATSLTYKTTGTITNAGTISAAAATTVAIDAAGTVTTGVLTTPLAASLALTGSKVVTLTGTVDLATGATVVISGSAGLKALGGLESSTVSVDASATSGANTLGATTVTAGIGDNTNFAGGSGVDTITVGATTKAITGGAGNDIFYVTSLSGGPATAGSIDAGEGTADVLGLTGTDATTLSASSTFAGRISGFERLTLNTVTSNSINLSNLDDINYVTIAGVNAIAINNATLSNLASGGTVVNNAGATGYAVEVKNATTGTSDVLNLSTSAATNIAIGTVTASGVETVNFLTDDSATIATGIQHTVTLSDSAATTLKVTGDAGLALTHTGTALTSFDASGVTKGDVSFTTGALASAATLTGGAGNDTIDASLATKNVNLQGNGGVDALTGGAGNDTISDISTYTSADGVTTVNLGNVLVGGAGSDTITGGEGRDNIDGGSDNDSIVAGGGNDTITAGTGNDTINAGDGDDTITLTGGNNVVDAGNGLDTITSVTGNDSIFGGADNDTIQFASTYLDANDTVDGGTGVNTIKITSSDTLTDADFTKVTNIQKLAVTTGETITATLGAKALASGLLTVTGSIGKDSITVSSDFNGSLTVALASDTADNGDVVDASASTATVTVTAKGKDLDVAAAGNKNDSLTGGAGTGDKLIITADSSGGAVDATNITGFETITITADGVNDLAFDANTLTVGIGKTLTLDASSFTNDAAQLTLDVGTSAGTFVIKGGAGGDNVDLTGATGNNTLDGAGGANTLTGGTGNDTLTSGDTGSSVYGAAGNDGITTGSGADNITGDDGDDTINAGTGVNTIDGGAGNDSITAGAGNDLIYGGVGDDTIVAGAGNDTVTGGAGADNITFTSDGIDSVIYSSASDSYLVAAATDALAVANMDTLTGFNFNGDGTTPSSIKVSGASATIHTGTYTVASAASKSLATALTGDTSFNLLFASGESDAVVVTVSAGTAAGTYLVIDSNLDGDYTAADTVVKLVNPVGSLSTTNLSDSSTTTAWSSGKAFTGTAADDVYDVAGNTAGSIVVNGEGGYNTIKLANSGDISAATVSNFTGLTLAKDAGVIMTSDQYDAFTGSITAPGTEQVTLTDVGTIVAKTGIENYSLFAASKFTDNASNNTITLSTGSNSLTLSGGGTDAVKTSTSDTSTLTVTASTGSVTVTSANADSNNNDTAGVTATVSGAAAFILNDKNTGDAIDIVTFTRALTTDDKFLADDTTDTTTLNLNAAQGSSAFTLEAANFTNVDTVYLGEASGIYNLVTKDANNIATIKNAKDVVLGNVTLDTSNETAAVTINLTYATTSIDYTGKADITVTATTADQSVTTGSGVDKLTATVTGSNPTALTASLGAGNDTLALTISATAIADGNLVIDGGSGTGDALTVDLGTKGIVVVDDIKGFESISTTSTGAISLKFADAYIDNDTTFTFAANGENITLATNAAETSSITVTAATLVAAKAYSFTTADGNDSITLTQSDDDGIVKDDTVILGKGTDTLTINQAGKALTIDMSGVTASSWSGVETLVIAGASKTDATTQVVTLDKDDGGISTVNASGATGGITVALGNTASAVTVSLGTGADVLTRTTDGSLATVTLGTGADTINSLSETATASLTINDFLVGTDVWDFGTTGVSETALTSTGATITSAGAGSATNAYILQTAAFQISGALSETDNGGAVELAIINAGVKGVVDTEESYFILDNGTSTGIYRAVFASITNTADVVDASDEFAVTLVGTLTNVLADNISAGVSFT